MATVEAVQGIRRFEKVEIEGVFQRLPRSYTYLIELAYQEKGKHSRSHEQITIQSGKIVEELALLLGKKKERIYFAHGMTDIDIFLQGDLFCIEVSPSSGLRDFFFLKKGELKKFYNIIASSK